MTYVHEFGHALGLAHASRFTVMHPDGSKAVHGGNLYTAGPMPDDAAGGRRLYPSRHSPKNLLASSQRLRSGVLTTNLSGSPASHVCPGDQITLHLTVGNNGTKSLYADERIFLKRTMYSSALASHTVANLSGRYFAKGTLDFTATPVDFIVPSHLVRGATYYVFHEVDWNNQHKEMRKDDNIVRNPKVIYIKPSCP